MTDEKTKRELASLAPLRRELAEARERAGDAEERASRAQLALEQVRLERDSARAALRALHDGLRLDDAPRRAAIDAARLQIEAWASVRVEEDDGYAG